MDESSHRTEGVKPVEMTMSSTHAEAHPAEHLLTLLTSHVRTASILDDGNPTLWTRCTQHHLLELVPKLSVTTTRNDVDDPSAIASYVYGI